MVQVGDVSIGSGKPKICASITETDRKSIIAAADILLQKRVDIIEWRIDYYSEVHHWDMVLETLQRLKMSLYGRPLLVTFRTKAEGGCQEIETPEYRELLNNIAQSGLVDMVDVEIFKDINYSDLSGEPAADVKEKFEELKNWIAALRQNVTPVGSYHNFNMTPEDDDLAGRMKLIIESGVDIPKMAVMPENRMDVMRLMMFTLKMTEQTDKPLITMSMSRIGSISRIAGEAFGSAVTFGSIGQESAPGQLPVNKLEEMLEMVHQNYQ